MGALSGTLNTTTFLAALMRNDTSVAIVSISLVEFIAVAMDGWDGALIIYERATRCSNSGSARA